MKLVLHQTTKKAVDDFIDSPAQAVLLVGPVGSGKGTLASTMAAELLQISPEKLENHPYVIWLRDQKNISIEDIRSIQKAMQLKTPGKNDFRRAVIIEQAETMSTEAQNAFLKLLEEPPADTLIILTVSYLRHLLPTIISRLQRITVGAPSQELISEYYLQNNAQPDIDRAYYLSEGYLGLLEAILQDNSEHPLVQQIQTAKAVLSSTLFERLCKVDEIAKDKNLALFLQALERVSHAALTQAVEKDSQAIVIWKRRLEAIVATEGMLSRSPQTKLLLTNLFLQF